MKPSNMEELIKEIGDLLRSNYPSSVESNIPWDKSDENSPFREILLEPETGKFVCFYRNPRKNSVTLMLLKPSVQSANSYVELVKSPKFKDRLVTLGSAVYQVDIQVPDQNESYTYRVVTESEDRSGSVETLIQSINAAIA